jgi:hypothetical protein
MRNSSNPELAKEPAQRAETDATFADLSVERPAKTEKPSNSPSSTAEKHEELSSTSFSFQVERTVEPPAATTRVKTFSKLDPERGRTSREALFSARTDLGRSTAAATKGKYNLRAGGRRAGQTSLLDRYVSFVAKILKAIEKFLLRKFNLTGKQQQRGQDARTPEEEVRSEKPKKKVGISGPGI